MYRINQQTNSIQKIEETTFKEIGASERNHLQEWIAKNPEVLCGEDESLLIIQKEFDGFNDTRERLDLLALDNHGNFVFLVDDDNSQLEALEVFKSEIESKFSKPLIWEKPTDKRFSKVQYTHPYNLVKQQFQQENDRPMHHWRDGKDWDVRIEVFKKYIVELYTVIQPYYDKVRSN